MNFNDILAGLGYTPNDALVDQAKRILSNADLDDAKISHILALNEKLKVFSGFVAMSNSEDVFKIKCESASKEDKDGFNDLVKEWASKYRFKVKKLDGKETYYVLGWE
ncbi:hypothetical protein CIG2463D_1568 [Campylobacter iguaniorum]|uniref:Type II secretion system protein n=1 Tax=Campylobacter iguaniorum TaxID=1244531 RepID=A0A076FAF6_9BACT|nr:hypothetical protein [Campylobacter iguaniorum]AII15200.1 hypothetical protein CIG1485E_1377 [Campylobacter iguaniorum]ALV25125.1 hypothetical protein CIG2463D_1568 [Campylobacter iguaniorum]